MRIKCIKIEERVFSFLKEVYNECKNDNSLNVRNICSKHRIDTHYPTDMINMGLLIYVKRGGRGPSIKRWVGAVPTKKLAISLIEASKIKISHKQKQPATPIFENCLTLVELRKLWDMHQAGCKVSTICLYMKISSTYAIECIEAAKHLYGGGLMRMRLDRYDIFHKNNRATGKYFHDDKRTINQRPPTVYSNRSPYGIAQPGTKESVTITSMNTF